MPDLRFDLRAALDDHEARTGLRFTYEDLSKATGLSVDALKSIASRDDYNVTLRSIEIIAEALNVNPIAFMRWEKNDRKQ